MQVSGKPTNLGKKRHHGVSPKVSFSRVTIPVCCIMYWCVNVSRQVVYLRMFFVGRQIVQKMRLLLKNYLPIRKK